MADYLGINSNSATIWSEDITEALDEYEQTRDALSNEIEELEDLREAGEAYDPELLNKSQEQLAEHEEQADEYKALQAFSDEISDYCPDWNYGVTLVSEDSFEDYVQELLEDCGEIPKDFPSYVVIDWEATAENIKVDYTEAKLGGVTFYAR